MELSYSLDGKVTLMTGATGGIGQDSCLALSTLGSDVGILYFGDGEAAASLAARIEGTGRSAYLIEQDLDRSDGLNAAVDQFVEQAGGIDILVNCAGVADLLPYTEVTPELMERTLRINTMAPFFLAQRAATHMIRQGRGGRIINVASINALVAEANLLPYNVSKGGLGLLTQSLAIELAPHGITVNNVSPGLVKTKILTETNAFWKEARRNIPLGRLAEPIDVGAAICFLASSAAGYITGQHIVVDGGLTIEQYPRDRSPDSQPDETAS